VSKKKNAGKGEKNEKVSSTNLKQKKGRKKRKVKPRRHTDKNQIKAEEAEKGGRKSKNTNRRTTSFKRAKHELTRNNRSGIDRGEGAHRKWAF